VVDDGLSRNGSFVNGERLSGRRRLDDADSLRLGHTSLLFRTATPPAESTVVADRGTVPRLTGGERRVLVSLCRPLAEPGGTAIPATNTQIAEELHLSVAGVKTHIRALFSKLGVEDLPQYQKRTALARRGLELGLVTSRDLTSG
jgi:ATP/maltotriose-dependent transcriptional regulator MalT